MEQIIINGIECSAIVAGREYTRLPAFWLESVRRMPLTRGGLTLPDPAGEEIQRVGKGDTVFLVMGYRGASPFAWPAEVVWAKPGTKHQTEFGLVGKDAVFSRVRFTEAWMDEAPEAILKNLLSRAGVTPGRIDETGVILPRFALSNETLWQAAEKLELSCGRAFGLDVSARALWMGPGLPDGAAHWGDFDAPEQESIPGVISGGNLINHTPATDAAGFGQVEAFLIPGLLHSYRFRLQDIYRDVSAIFRAQKVRHESDGGRVRTFISYGKERERY